MADEIELAHKLSLVQRNLDMAQTALDSAVEFFGQAMSEIQTLFNAGRGIRYAPENGRGQPGFGGGGSVMQTQPAPSPQETLRAIAAPEDFQLPAADAIRRYMKHHPGAVFGVKDVMAFSSGSYHAKAMRSALGGLKRAGEIEHVAYGQWRAAEVKPSAKAKAKRLPGNTRYTTKGGLTATGLTREYLAVHPAQTEFRSGHIANWIRSKYKQTIPPKAISNALANWTRRGKLKKVASGLYARPDEAS